MRVREQSTTGGPADETFAREGLADETLARKVPQTPCADACKGERRRKHIAHETRRDLVARDGVRCAFVGSDGRRCEAREFLQFHHRRAWARGGCDAADNLELLCRSHNLLLAERDFGRSQIEAAVAARKLNPRESTLAGPAGKAPDEHLRRLEPSKRSALLQRKLAQSASPD